MVHDRAVLLISTIDFISIFFLTQQLETRQYLFIYTHVKRQCYTQRFGERVQQSQLIKSKCNQ